MLTPTAWSTLLDGPTDYTVLQDNMLLFLHRAANLYFLFLALLNWVPIVEAFEKEITMIPLLVVLTVIAIKDALEDYRRYLFDKKVNNNLVRVFCGWVHPNSNLLLASIQSICTLEMLQMNEPVLFQVEI